MPSSDGLPEDFGIAHGVIMRLMDLRLVWRYLPSYIDLLCIWQVNAIAVSMYISHFVQKDILGQVVI